LMERLNNAGFSVVRYDHRGYGKSEGERAYVDKFDLYIQDLNLIIDKYRQIGIPMFLMGVSMGGLIITRYVMDFGRAGIAGIINLSPALKIDDGISPFLRKISGFLGSYLPKLKTIKLESEALSRTPGVREDYLNDPLVYHKGAKSRTGLEMLRAMVHVQENFHKIDLPVLILHGTEDRLADPQGSKWMIEKIKSEDKSLELLDGLYHEITREPEKEDVFKSIIDWLSSDKRLLNADLGTEIA